MSLKDGRKYFYLNESYSKHIGVEWVFRPFDILNFNITIDGGEGEYRLQFWFFWIFYISSNIFTKFPKEWNSQANNKQGGYLDTATRRIGISQYSGYIDFYLWHSGENLWYPDKEKQYFYYNIDLIGSHKYLSSEEIYGNDYRKFNEGLQHIMFKKFTQTKTYNRFYMKPFNKKYFIIEIDSDIKVPQRRISNDLKFERLSKEQIYLDNEYVLPKKRYYMKNKNEDCSIFIDKYVAQIMNQRKKYYDDWVPYKYLKNYIRLKKLKNILNDDD